MGTELWPTCSSLTCSPHSTPLHCPPCCLFYLPLLMATAANSMSLAGRRVLQLQVCTPPFTGSNWTTGTIVIALLILLAEAGRPKQGLGACCKAEHVCQYTVCRQVVAFCFMFTLTLGSMQDSLLSMIKEFEHPNLLLSHPITHCPSSSIVTCSSKIRTHILTLHPGNSPASPKYR